MIDKCKNTNFYFGPIKNSVFFRDCENCTIHVACNQFRCRDLYNSTVYLFCETEPIIESSSNLTFAPYNLAYPHLDRHVDASGLDISQNKWDLVFDFTDTNETGEKESHHKLLDPSEFEIVRQEVEDMYVKPSQPFAIPRKYGGDAPDNDLTQKKQEEGTFDIRTTSAADAQKIYEEHQKRQEEKESAEQQEENQDQEEIQDQAENQEQELKEDQKQDMGDSTWNQESNEYKPAPDEFNATGGKSFSFCLCSYQFY